MVEVWKPFPRSECDQAHCLELAVVSFGVRCCGEASSLCRIHYNTFLVSLVTISSDVHWGSVEEAREYLAKLADLREQLRAAHVALGAWYESEEVAGGDALLAKTHELRRQLDNHIIGAD